MTLIYLSASQQTDNTYPGPDQTGTFNETDDDEMHWAHKIVALSTTLLKSIGFDVRNNLHQAPRTLGPQMKEANSLKADSYHALHTNAGGGGKARGAEVFALAPGGNAEKYARIIYKHISNLTPVADRGVKFANFAELRETNMPATLTEVEFHDSIEGAKWIRANWTTIAAVWAAGIAECHGKKLIAGENVKPTPTKPAQPSNIFTDSAIPNLSLPEPGSENCSAAFAIGQAHRQSTFATVEIRAHREQYAADMAQLASDMAELKRTIKSILDIASQ